MVRASLSFFVLALVAYFFGAYGIAGLSMDIARILLYVFLGLAMMSLAAWLITGQTPKGLP